MPVQLYNEGRVVGYSAYELYVRHAKSKGIEPASEMEWLSSSIASGSSLLLEVRPLSDTTIQGPHSVDIPLPSNTKLCAANTIIGSFFDGNGSVTDTNPWATNVVDYGYLISNTDTLNPGGASYPDATTLPSKSSSYKVDPNLIKPADDWPISTRNKLKEYIKLIDGLVLQPGNWITNTADTQPAADFSPDLSESAPCLRLLFSERITQSFFILLTGFTLDSVIAGVSGTDGSTNSNTNFAENGGYLGPGVYPWANKVIFSIPPAFVNYFIKNNYIRKLPATDSELCVNSTPIIDMESTDLDKYYSTYAKDCQVDLDVTDISTYGDNAAVITVYQRNAALPPALFGTRVDETGVNTINPIDTVAPGTIKLFTQSTAESDAKLLENLVPHNYAFMRDSDYVLHQLNDAQVVTPVADIDWVDLTGALQFVDMTIPYFMVEGTFNRAGERKPEDAPSDLTQCKPGVITLKRVVGKLSKKIQDMCGYEYDSPVFAAPTDPDNKYTGGIWQNATKSLVNQIPESKRSEYYYMVGGTAWVDWNAGGINNNIIWPVRKADHMIDVVMRYGAQIYVDGVEWAPIFYDDTSHTANSDWLGSWWSGKNLSEDQLIAGIDDSTAYHSGWAIISASEHPTILSRNIENSLIYYPTAVLPANIEDVPFEDYYNTTSMLQLFGESVLEDAGIKPEFQNVSVLEFSRKCLYLDMGTGQPLPIGNSNLSQTQWFTNNAVAGNEIVGTFSISLNNNESNSGKPQYVKLPESLIDMDTLNPLGVITSTGNKQAITISLTDRQLQLYNLAGTSENLTNMRDGTIHWDDLLLALAQNKSIDILHTDAFIKRVQEMFISDLGAGVGISIVWSPERNQFVITNTMPYNAAGIGYTRLTQGSSGDFIVTPYNGFRTFDNNSQGWVDGINLGVRVLPSLDKDEDGDPLSIAIIVDSVYATESFNYALGKPMWGTKIGNETLKGFYWPSVAEMTQAAESDPTNSSKSWPTPGYAFKHSDALDSETILGDVATLVNVNTSSDPQYRYAYGKLSHIFGITFTDTGNYRYLNNPKYKFRNTSESGTGIWNIVTGSDGQTCGGSWMAMGSIGAGSAAGRSATLVGYINSYADGYNTQLNIWDSDSSDASGRGKNLWSKYINYTVTGMFYQQ